MNGTGANVLIKFTGDTKDVNAKMTGLNKTMGSVTKGFVAGSIITKGLSTAFSMVSSSAGSAVKRLDTMNNFPKVMSNLGVSAKDSEDAIKTLSDKLQGLPTSIDTGAAAVQRFTSKNGDVKKSTDLFLAMNNAILAGGAPAEQQASAMEQLSQAYAKGKPDMMEWRSIQSVMPAQLKQIATQMGYAGGNADKLGEDLRSGKVSMDDFMNAVTDLNKNGGKGFKSFEEQARNSTGGIQTSIANMKTAITRGLANAFDSLDKTLQDAGLGGISGVISNIGKGFEKVLKSIVPLIPPMVKFAQVLIKLAPIWAPIVAGLIAYQKAMQLANKVTQLTQGLSNLPGIFGKIGSSAQNGVSGIMNFAKAHKGLSIGIGLAGVAIGGAIALYKKSGGDANKMAQMVTQKVNKITATITQIAQKLPQIIKQVLPKILNAITTALPVIINAIVTALPIVINALVNALTTVIPILMNAVVQIITMLANMLPTLIPILIQGAITLILALANALPKIITSLVSALPKIITSIVNGLIKCLPQLIQGAIKLVIGLVKALPQIIKALIKALPQIIKSLVTAIISLHVEFIKAGVQLIKALWNGFKSWVSNLWTNIKNFARQIPQKIKSGLGKIGEIGTNIVKGIGNAITNGIGWIKGKIKEFVGNVKSFLKKLFGIKSPSKWAKVTIGGNIVLGIAKGLASNKTAVRQAASNLSDNVKKLLQGKKTNYAKIGKTLGQELISGIEESLKSIRETADKFKETLSKVDLWGNNGLTDLSVVKEQVRNYAANLNKLKNQIPTSLYSQIMEMDREQGLQYTNALLNMDASALKDYVSNWNAIQNESSKLANQWYESEAQKQAKTIANKYAQTLKTQFASINKLMGGLGKKATQGLINGMLAQTKNLKGAGKTISNSIVNSLKKALKIKSPSRVMMGLGKYTTEGFIEGITSMQRELDSIINSTFGLSPTVTGTASTHFSPEVNVTVQNNMKTDPLGQVVNNVKTFSGGAKNDYNYGIGG